MLDLDYLGRFSKRYLVSLPLIFLVIERPISCFTVLQLLLTDSPNQPLTTRSALTQQIQRLLGTLKQRVPLDDSLFIRLNDSRLQQGGYNVGLQVPFVELILRKHT